MRAFQVTSSGQQPLLTEIPCPVPGPGEILVRITACGLNFADLLMIKGQYQETPEAPFTLGLEVAGIVEALGPDTDGPAIGTRVAIFGGSGGLAEYGVFPAERAVVVPDSMSDEIAAGFQVAYGTSHLAYAHRARLQPGENLVVLGAAGGVGLTAVEIGKVMGANVIACARGADKLAVAKAAGADHVLDTETDNIRDTVKALGGADVVYDPVGGDLFMDAFRACNPDARILTIGFAGGQVPEPKLNHMLVKNITVIGFYWGGYLKFNPKALTDSMAQLMLWHSEGKLRPHVSHVLPFDQAAEGLRLLKERKSTGKIVIRVSDA
ncbi:MAG: NADPH:quinone oxidoreductase family protein [Paracoccaceae bacterium]|jgi:NADPH2:quinone reductase|nr:NADPH:quinone oxidoreductase family protein [Paracoccaceae bacterium]MDP7185252.1 NADPH:quinone oxidoreductase family protein [Paracoccaceae bacterium]